MATFQGSPLDHESAWKIMEGHWIESPCSWRPVLGQNPAYDYFPSQYNSWYRDPKGNRGWYDPVFKVITLDGREVWRKRHLAPVHPSRTVQMDWVSRGFKRFQVIQGEGLSWIRLDMLDVCQIFLRQNRFYTFPFCPLFRVCVSWAEQGQTWKALAAVGKCDRFCKLQYLF